MELSSLKDTENFSKKISKSLKSGDIIFLYGEIGAGKTTFARFLINHLEIQNGIKKSHILSPTFNIVYEYEINNILIKHFDLYRLRSKDELNNLGIFDNTEDIITIIEWPELIDEKPLNRLELYFKYAENMEERNLEIYFYGRLKENKF